MTNHVRHLKRPDLASIRPVPWAVAPGHNHNGARTWAVVDARGRVVVNSIEDENLARVIVRSVNLFKNRRFL